MVPSHDDIQESNNEVVVDEPCGEIVKDLDEVVETTCVEDVGSLLGCLEVVDSHPRLEVGLQIEPTKKHEFENIVNFIDFVHDSRFVEFHPTKFEVEFFLRRG